jgi:hypothetical protein
MQIGIGMSLLTWGWYFGNALSFETGIYGSFILEQRASLSYHLRHLNATFIQMRQLLSYAILILISWQSTRTYPCRRQNRVDHQASRSALSPSL